MDEDLEPTAESPRKRHYQDKEDLEDLAPSGKRIRISPVASPVPPELLQLAPPLESDKAKVYRSVSFEPKDQEMPDQEPQSDKAPCECNGKDAKLEFDDDGQIQDAEFAFLHCDETVGESQTEPEAEPLTQPEPVVKTEGGCSRLIDSAKKFVNEEKTPLKSSNLFNTSALLRSASQSLAGMLATPPTTNKPPVDKKTPSSKGKGMCHRMSQADVFGEDSSSDSDDEDK
jgi:hypothetical protein